MALIKCPECNNKISDQADTCPKCGYELKKKITIPKIDGDKKNRNIGYVLIVIAVIIGGYFIFFNNKTNDTPKGDNNNPTTSQNGNFIFNESGMYFEYPNTYKTYVDSQGSLYVGQNIDSKGALIPYIMIERYKGYTDPVELITEFTSALQNEYPDTTITINMLSNYIGDKYVYGIQYAYTSSGHVVIDNRYAFLLNNRMYFIATREENVNTNEINNATRLIIETLKEVNS